MFLGSGVFRQRSNSDDRINTSIVRDHDQSMSGFIYTVITFRFSTGIVIFRVIAHCPIFQLFKQKMHNFRC